jgi:NAD(P)H dehydrogenase (quinone)
MRNQIYSELMYSMIVEQGLSDGPWVHNSKMGGFAPVSRADIAACAAAIMQKPEEHRNVSYEITGPERFNFPKVVELAEKLWGEKIEFIKVSDEEMYALYEKVGIPRTGDPSQTFIPLVFGSDELVKQYRAYEMHLLDIQTAHVEMITGNKPRSMESVLKEMIAAN